MNYIQHNKELDGALYKPENPVIFTKCDSALLKDRKPFFIPDWSKQVDISRSTVQEIYESARRKIAACLVHGKPLHITGGNYRICGGQEATRCGRCGRMQRANTEKSNKKCEGDSIMKIAGRRDG